MSQIDRFARRQPWCYRGHDVATRRKLCFCGCGQVVGPKRSSSAGPECVKRWRSHSDMNHIRFKVGQRDKGVCALCGANTKRLKAEWHAALIAFHVERSKGYSETYRNQWHRNIGWTHVMQMFYGDPLLPRPPTGFPTKDRSWWEADHIVPVSEGGGGCDFTGYRTLCTSCHKKETALLAARLAEKRRATKRAQAPELILL